MRKNNVAMYGYIRCSPLKGERTPEVQIAELTRKAGELGGVLSQVFVDPVVTDNVTGKKAAILSRPAGREMLDTLRTGDTLIVARVDRLGYRLSDLHATVGVLAERGVEIRVLSSADGELSLRPDIAKFVLRMFALWAGTDRALRSERSCELAQWRKADGLAYGGVPTGRRIVQRNGVKRLVWDEEQLGHIAEIAYRLPREGVAKVAEDFWQRGIKNHRGLPWGGQTPKPFSLHRSPYQQFYRAARWFHRAKRKGLLPSPYSDLAECIEEPKGFREEPQPRRWTPGGTARREQERAEAKANHQAERLARWEAEKAARVQSRVHKPKLDRQTKEGLVGQ